MSYKTIIALIIAVLVIVGFIVWKAPLHAPSPEETDTTTPTNTSDESNTIVANHFYDPKTSTHVVEGAITLPTPCDTLQYEVSTLGAADTDVTIAFTSTSTAEICTQVLSQKIFHAEFVAAQNASVHATLNGQARELKLSSQGDAIEKL